MTDKELISQYSAGDVEAVNLLYKNFEPYMIRLAYKWRMTAAKVGLDEEDLQQEGWIAFVKLLDELEGEMCTCSFSTYAYGAVEFAIRNVIRNNRPRGYKSSVDKNDISIFSIYQHTYPGEESSEMLVDSIASETFPSVDHFIEDDYQHHLRNDLLLMLDLVFGGNLSNANDVITIDPNYILKKMKVEFNAAYLLLLHYGLFGETMTLTSISKETGYSVSRLSQMELDAFQKIRNSFAGKQLMNLYTLSVNEKIQDLMMQKNDIQYHRNPEKVILHLDEINSRIEKYLIS
ncbi:sigma-70 family RNA polymerase sigma factor [Chakrabartyella piscis]|uniref:sigma-70 family RNA polymerase sigma factor n=1 Tax=Chakrabartyella piscis TaxID=2918914 RepID=UPI00295846D8|nr:sigma-70 family RNA polymerase sigma factor [Chakrabartyella piscis]